MITRDEIESIVKTIRRIENDILADLEEYDEESMEELYAMLPQYDADTLKSVLKEYRHIVSDYMKKVREWSMDDNQVGFDYPDRLTLDYIVYEINRVFNKVRTLNN